MRTDDLSGGSLKALLLALLVAANIVAALPHNTARPRTAAPAQAAHAVRPLTEKPSR